MWGGSEECGPLALVPLLEGDTHHRGEGQGRGKGNEEEGRGNGETHV